jgi:hypothetical protein
MIGCIRWLCNKLRVVKMKLCNKNFYHSDHFQELIHIFLGAPPIMLLGTSQLGSYPRDLALPLLEVAPRSKACVGVGNN